ncbi:MAG TPA: phospholipid carrier-dependent glycosyltransferase, partial [Nitriliruptorales bacterium]|nr:phospholipid carrier-dependent glycosyltransferase [Nitriliruptorales bacterium]
MTVLASGPRPATSPVATRTAWRDPVLVGGLVAVLALAAALRTVTLTAHLPQLVAPDEPTTVERAAAALRGDLVPPAWDWPPTAAYLLAGVARVLAAVRPQLLDADHADLYTLGRWVSALVSVVVVALTALLASVVVTGHRARRLVVLGATATVAVSYLAVRNARITHPEQLQLAFLLVSLVLTTRLRSGAGRWTLAGAGVAAGLAGATKYVGLIAALPLALEVARRGDRAARARRLSLAAGATTAGFLLGTLGTAYQVADLWEGLTGQLRHQAGGHLGYEADLGGWWFHLTHSLPGNFGVVVTALALIGLALVFARRAPRAVPLAVTLVPLLGLAAVTRVRFPHYVLVDVPLLAVLAWLALDRTVAWLRPRAGRVVAAACVAVVAVSLVPALVDDVRLIRASRSTDTRELALRVVEELPAEAVVWAEDRSLPLGAPGVRPWSGEPTVLDHGGYLLLSSHMEERYRRRPDLYADEVAVHAAVRARGDVVAVVRPSLDLSYRWDLLPRWGLRRVPLAG